MQLGLLALQLVLGGRQLMPYAGTACICLLMCCSVGGLSQAGITCACGSTLNFCQLTHAFNKGSLSQGEDKLRAARVRS
jgi:hypothetical protein